ncbi:hypothetical protein GGI02_003504 [Coemansia sp. RSA 2322]|nr:hypothetical protein GGI02_003504 [Coemansia sp. RSA 2322]
MAVLFVFDNIGNMLGPLLGGMAYEKMGVGGIAIIAMGLGVAELFFILLFVRNSLDIRLTLTRDREAAESAGEPSLEPSMSELVIESTVASRRPSAKNPSAGSSCVSISSASSTPTDSGSDASGGVSTPKSTSETSAHGGIELLRLMLQLPVVGPTVSIFVATGMQSVIETVFPLRLSDKFGYSPGAIGVAFLLVGGVLIMAMPAVGYVNDTVISRHGERMRYYTIAIGVLLMLTSLTITAVAGSYAVLIFGYSLFAVTSMLVIVPAQSAFGDFINASGSQAMAQCYSLAWIAEGMANISLPPIAKTTTLKFGLNTPKSSSLPSSAKKTAVSAGAETARSVKSVFADSEDTPGSDSPKSSKVPFSGGLQTCASERVAAELEATDPSIYAYDDVYEEISDTRKRMKQSRKQGDDLKPRYMDKILATAKQRQIQHEVVRERMLDKEREKEGDLYADKEAFVTNAYKEQKEQRQRLVEEEEVREAEEANKHCHGSLARAENLGAAAAAGFYRGYLDQIDRDDIGKVAVTGLDKAHSDQVTTRDPTDTLLFPACQREPTGAGLGVVSDSARRRLAQIHALKPAVGPDNSNEGAAVQPHRAQVSARQAGSSFRSYHNIVEQGLNELSQKEEESRRLEHEALVKKYARRNDTASIEAARQRYLLRKQHAL